MLYPIGIQSFESIREGGYVYVDKTHLIHQLATTGKYYFLSRPRRFGKSLLVSTMEAYFQGKKDLFKGLAIEKLEKVWAEYPVLHLDLSGKTYNKAEDLEMLLDMHLCRWEKAFDMQTRYSEPDIRFQTLIDTAYEKTGKPVVILIDEYDKPLLDSAGNEELREAYRSRLQGFYSVMKTRDGKIRFGFLTGITKLGKLSVFSGLNNLNDISMDWEFSGICGISEKELHTCFDQEVSAMAQANRLTKEECYAKLKDYYDGYHFCDGAEDIYNPFSLLSALRKKRFSDYWYETGTPTFVVKALRSGKFNLEDLTLEGVPASALGGVNADDSDPVPVLYQSGYLTIKSYDERWERYTLKYPNKEVERGFMQGLANIYVPSMRYNSPFDVQKFVEDFEKGDAESLMKRFEAFFADADYEIVGDAELYFQNTMYVMCKLMGQYTQVERHTSNGRMDIVVQTDKYVYIMELKMDAGADEALQQIEDKGYAKPFAADARRIFKIGVGFSSETRRIKEWKMA
ncbi:MAG: ATP-binding protein [Bacteroidetes bacterium]|uniref:ATP-binding protein n=1 Tax=Candidatus Pullibacteroides excrementavium TaxID=2840905 RepID=A0A9D9DST9_9BACT|nr:ATP-binding protein [Candidatus Pullibacteroides excrementavium]